MTGTEDDWLHDLAVQGFSQAASYRLLLLHTLGLLYAEQATHRRTQQRLKDADAQIAYLMGLRASPEPIDPNDVFAPDTPDGPRRERHPL